MYVSNLTRNSSSGMRSIRNSIFERQQLNQGTRTKMPANAVRFLYYIYPADMRATMT